MALCFATNNRHKIEEVKTLLPEGYPLLSLKDIGCDLELPETHQTLEENACQKAQYVKEHFGIDCFADDSGLEVEALQGAPGVRSARYAGPDKNDRANCSKLLQELAGVKKRSASFRTVICLVRGAGGVYYFDGVVRGTITREPHGSGGFGYDPLFRPDGERVTFAQMSAPQKNRISHRGRAVEKLVKFLRAEL